MKPVNCVSWTLTAALAVHLMFPAAAAESHSELICEVKRQSDVSFLYKLSKAPRSTNCMTCWEDGDKVVIARDSLSNNCDLVLNVTSQFMILTRCLDYLHYTQDCLQEDFNDVHCRVNCSLFMERADQPDKENTTLTCVFGDWCPDQLTMIIIVGGILIAAGVVVALFCWKTGKCKRRESATERISYSPANIKIERVEGGDGIE